MARRLSVLALLSLPLLAGARTARAQDVIAEGDTIRMEEIQAVATRTPRDAFEVPAPVDVVSREQIEEVQADRVGDVFSSLAGVEVEGDGPFLGRPVLRGLSGNRVLVLVDGQRLNNAREAINFGGVEPGLVDVGSIEEVEIVRGPASVLYGSDAIGGIVNLVTRRAAPPESGVAFEGRLTTRYGTADDQRGARLDLSLATRALSIRAHGAARDAESYESPEGTVPFSAAETRDLGADVTWRANASHTFRAEVQTFRGRDVGVPGGGGVFTGFYPRTDRSKAAVAWEGRDLGALGRVEARAFVQDQTENFSTVLDLPPISAGPFELLIDTESSRVGDIRTLGLDVQVDTPVGARQLVTWGIDLFEDDVDEVRRETSTRVLVPRAPGPPGRTTVVVDSFPTTPESSFRGAGLYVQDEIVAGRWTIVPGARYDRFDLDVEPLVREEGEAPGETRTEDAVSGSVGVLFRAAPSLHLVGTVGRAFRTPNVIERYFFGPGSQGGLSVPNPDLENETSLNVDLGLKARRGGTSASATVFRNRISDYITFVPGTFQGEPEFGGEPVSTVGNVGEALIEGVEAELAHRRDLAGGTASATLALAWTRGENRTDDTPLFVPPAKAVVGLGWGRADGLVSGIVRGRFVDGETDVPEGFDPAVGFAVFDAHAAVDLAPWLGRDVVFRAGVDNVTDRAYREPYSSVLAPGRGLVLSLELGLTAESGR